MTLEQIVAALEARGIRDVASAMPRVYREWRHCSLERAEQWYRAGHLGQVEYEAYCYLWRNTTPRLSEELQGYEL